MDRFDQVLLFASTLVSAWLGMQAVHELGHVAVAWWTGARVERVVLHPLTISRTDLAEGPADPNLLLVAWAGPIFGAVVPFLIWGSRSGGDGDGRICCDSSPGSAWRPMGSTSASDRSIG